MKPTRIFWFIIFIIGLAVRSTELFHPVDTSEWRESDVSSIARNYYRNGMEFTHPQIDWGGTGPGYTESEFPVYPYLIALSYKLFGIWEPTGRIISFLFSFGTLIIFFRLSSYLFTKRTALVVSSFFALSPLLMITSNTIQPESMMFFFYILSAYSFIQWMDNQSTKYYIWTFVFTALAILCKLTAINIGIFFVLLIITNKGWKFLLTPKVILLGALSVLPSIIWYSYSHSFYIKYGNSLGLSNQYAWIGPEFFTNSMYIRGIVKQELLNVWSISGPLIVLIALFSTKLVKNKNIILPACWFASAFIFYIIAARSTSSPSSYYYHIFSIPSASMLIGISVVAIYEKYFPSMNLRSEPSADSRNVGKSRLVMLVTFFLVLFFLAFGFKYLSQSKHSVFKTLDYYACKSNLEEIIPKNSLILVSGGICSQGKYLKAYNASYFFYWLDLKGFNICIGDQTIDNVMAFKAKGAKYYIAEIRAMKQQEGFEDIMRKKFDVELESNGIVLFKL
jgi:hypothetical protein